MKKRFSFLLITLLLMGGCQNEESKPSIPLLHYEKACMEMSGTKVTRFLSLSSEEYDFICEKKVSSMVYVLASGCNSCDLFGYIMKTFVKKHDYILPFMTYDAYMNSKNHLNITDSAILFLNEGKVDDYMTDFSDIGSVEDLEGSLRKKTYDSKIYVHNESETSTTLESFDSYRFLSRKDSCKDFESCLFLKETKITQFMSIMTYMNDNGIKDMTFNSSEQTTEEKIFGIPYGESTCLEIHFDGNKKVENYKYFDEKDI